MRKITLYACLGFAGCGTEEEIEVDDDTSDEELDKAAYEMAQEWAQSWEGDERLGFDWEEEGASEEFYEGVEGWWEEEDE